MLHFHLPAWAYLVLGTVGAFVVHQFLKPMLISLTNLFWSRHDEPVWEVLKEPKFRPWHESGGKISYTAEEIPYSIEQLTAEIGRSKRSILSALRRLEKRGKVKEVHLGWLRKEK